MVDRTTWTPPDAPARAERGRVPGALGGSRLLELPALAPLRDAIEAFIAVPGRPLALDIGFDDGRVLLAEARARPEEGWLGLEIRAHRVAEVAARAPENCLPARMDARTLLASGLLDGRLSRADVLFPTPALRGRHLLWTPAFVADLTRALGSSGVLTVASDVPALSGLMAELLSGWPETERPQRAGVPSRREAACARDGIPVWWSSRRPPGASGEAL
jgi:tRNA G46 methylase TrmB